MQTDKTYDTGEVVLSYFEGGKIDAPPLVLIHGLTSQKADMIYPLSALQQDWHVYAPDLRGHGKSGQVADNRYDLSAYARDIIAFLKGVVKAPALVIGHSFGALTTIGAASGYPEGVTAAVLLDPPLYSALDPRGIDTEPNIKEWLQFMYDFKSSLPSHEQLLALSRQNMEGAPEEMIREMADTLAGVAPGAVQAALEKGFWGDLDLEQALDNISCPALMIHGDWEAGALVRESDIEFFKTHLPSAMVVRLPGVAHGLNLASEPDVVLQHIHAFLQTV